MGLKVTNNAFGTLNASINSSATTIVLVAGQGARFPTLSAGDYFYATLIDTSNNLEIVKVTARSTDTLTVVRAQDSTTARAYATNDRFELRPTAVMLNEIITTAEAALPKAGGTLTGNLVVNNTVSSAGDLILDGAFSVMVKKSGSTNATINQLGIGLTGSSPSNGVGITFPATQSASSNANTLDDYEEGTWTPAITGSTTVGSCTYTAQNGTYVKIGTYVYFACDIQPSSAPTGTGLLFIAGLPFTTVNNQFSMSIGLPYWNGAARAFTTMGGYTDGSSTRVVMIGTLGAATGISYLAPSDFSTSSRLFFAGVYQTQN